MPTNDGGSTALTANPSLDELRAYVGENFQATAPSVRGGGGFINFAKGEWTIGADRQPLDLDALWLVNPASLMHGWICWRDGKKWGEVLISTLQKLPAETTLPPPPPPGENEAEGYQQQLGFSATCIEGAYAGKPDDKGAVFKSSSVGGAGAITELAADMKARFEECKATGSRAFFPIIQYGTRSYMHNIASRGKIYVPTITIVGFSTNVPGEEPEWIEDEDAAPPPPPPPPTKTRLRRVAAAK